MDAECCGVGTWGEGLTETSDMGILEWIDQELRPRECNSEEFFYDDMESQSGFCLPLIYTEFDLGKRGHWCDRGAVFDFLLATEGEGKRLLDFGPGDGWPSLIVAPFAGEVVGVDGSRKRVDVCRQNAERMGISNASFVQVEVGGPLPFEDGSFDGAMAASSVEQTPDPRAVLAELHRILKPGGRIRILYEDLDRYRGGKEQEMNIESLTSETSRLICYDRHPEEEYASMYSVVLSLSAEAAMGIMGIKPSGTGLPPSTGSTPSELPGTEDASPESISMDPGTVPPERMKALVPHLVEARHCRLTHPSGRTFASWLEEIGFRDVSPSHSGIKFAGCLFESLAENERPKDLLALDRLLRRLVGIVVEMPAPLDQNPMITATK